MHNVVAKWGALLIVSSAIFLSVIDLFIVNVAIPSIKKGLEASDGDMQLVIVLYVIGYASFLITGGRAGDYFGKKKVFITGILVFTFASAVCGIAQNPWQLNVGRLVQGISAAFMVPQGIAFIPQLFVEPKAREKAFGIYGSIAGTASVIGQFLGGLLPDIQFFIAGWRLVFLINLPLGLLAAAAAFIYLKEEPRRVSVIHKLRDFNFVGVLLLILALITLLYPIIEGRELGWPRWAWLMLSLSPPFLLLFLFNQRKRLTLGKEPLIQMQLFKDNYFSIGLLAALFYYMAQDTYFLINAIQLQEGLQISSSMTGIYFVFQGLGYVLASFLSIKLVARYGKYVLIGGIAFMLGALLLHLQVLQIQRMHTLNVFFMLFVYGMGCGSVLPTMFTLSLKNMPGSLAGAASGLYLTFQQIAIGLGVGVVGGVFFYLLGNETDHETYYQAYRMATLLNMGLLILVGLVCFRLPRK